MGGTLFDQPVSHVMTGMASITVNGIISLGLYFRVAANYIDPVMMKDLRKFLGWYTPTCRVYCVISEDEIRPLVGTRRLMDVSCLKTNRSMILQMGPMI